MNNDFPQIFIINHWIKPASFGSERVYPTTIFPEKNASTITVSQTTLSFTFHDKIFEPVSLPGDSLNINTRERHTGLYATFNTVVDLAWNATAQEMFLCFIFIFFNPLHSKITTPQVSIFLVFNRASGILSSCGG